MSLNSHGALHPENKQVFSEVTLTLFVYTLKTSAGGILRLNTTEFLHILPADNAHSKSS